MSATALSEINTQCNSGASDLAYHVRRQHQNVGAFMETLRRRQVAYPLFNNQLNRGQKHAWNQPL